MKGKNFLKLLDYTSAEIELLLDTAADFKEKKKAPTFVGAFLGKV